MKTGLLFIVLIVGNLFPSAINGQPYFNVSGGVGAGSHINLRSSADFVLPGNFSVGFTFQSHQRQAPDRPDNCDVVISRDNGAPSERMLSFGGLLGYVLFDPYRKHRYHLRTGFVVNRIHQMVNFRPAAYSVEVWGPNYVYDTKRSANFGVLIEPRVEFLNSDTVGLALGLYANLNPAASSWGVNLDVLLGRLR